MQPMPQLQMTVPSNQAPPLQPMPLQPPLHQTPQPIMQAAPTIAPQQAKLSGASLPTPPPLSPTVPVVTQAPDRTASDAMEIAADSSVLGEVEASATDDPYGASSMIKAMAAAGMDLESSESEVEQDPAAFRACLAGACTDDTSSASKSHVG